MVGKKCYNTSLDKTFFLSFFFFKPSTFLNYSLFTINNTAVHIILFLNIPFSFKYNLLSV